MYGETCRNQLPWQPFKTSTGNFVAVRKRAMATLALLVVFLAWDDDDRSELFLNDERSRHWYPKTKMRHVDWKLCWLAKGVWKKNSCCRALASEMAELREHRLVRKRCRHVQGMILLMLSVLDADVAPEIPNDWQFATNRWCILEGSMRKNLSKNISTNAPWKKNTSLRKTKIRRKWPSEKVMCLVFHYLKVFIPNEYLLYVGSTAPLFYLHFRLFVQRGYSTPELRSFQSDHKLPPKDSTDRMAAGFLSEACWKLLVDPFLLAVISCVWKLFQENCSHQHWIWLFWATPVLVLWTFTLFVRGPPSVGWDHCDGRGPNGPSLVPNKCGRRGGEWADVCVFLYIFFLM